MNRSISLSRVSGVIKAPPSKSAMQRYVAAALLAEGDSHILNASDSEDAQAALRMAAELGATIKADGNGYRIKGGLLAGDRILDGGESGLGIRMFSSIAALTHGSKLITGRGSALTRPMGQIEAPLRALGASVKSNKGLLPMEISGPLRGGHVSIDGSLSSQYLTGLLMALPLCEKDSVIDVKKLRSRPYIDMTIGVLKKCGVVVENIDYKQFRIKGGQKYTPFETSVEGDWSGASILLVMGAVKGMVTVEGIQSDSCQADRVILDAIRMAGAGVVVNTDSITVEEGKLEAFNFDISDCPDLAPALSVLAMAARGQSRLRGANRLVAKESNRALTLTSLFSSLGGDIRLSGNEIIIRGGKELKSGVADSFNDHRIAMAAAAVSLITDGPVGVLRSDCVNKSYPGFYKDIITLGAEIKEI